MNYRLPLEAFTRREQQEEMIGRTILLSLAEATSTKINDLNLGLPLTTNKAALTKTWVPHSCAVLDALLSGAVESVLFNKNGAAKVAGLPPYSPEEIRPQEHHYLLYPGSFNPLHWGHTELARTASAIVQATFDCAETKPRPVVVTYEVALSRVGKEDLTHQEINDHVEQFTSQGHRVAVTTAKMFVDKARLFPHHGLVVGIDTVVRVLDPQYYGGSRTAMIDALNQIKSHHCYFVVGGRLRGDQWVDMSSVEVPTELRDMFVPIPQSLFRVDISSTEIRKRRQSR